jgi:anti-anti-sigma factor
MILGKIKFLTVDRLVTALTALEWVEGLSGNALSMDLTDGVGVSTPPQDAVVAPVGELDVANVAEFRADLLGVAHSTTADVIVDLSEVEFIDSSGVGAILELNEELRRAHRRLAVVAPRGTAGAVLLTLAGLRRRLRVFDSRAAAQRH